ncbi:MAG: hypothetical protein ABI267_02720 [Ginsengibacter sp.]
MESIREIVVPENNKIELIVPDNFIGKKVEIFAFEMGDVYGENKNRSNRHFTVANVKLDNYKFNREEANER